MNPKLLDILACPFCQQKLNYLPESAVLICYFDHLLYRIRNGIPQLSRMQAIPLVKLKD